MVVNYQSSVFALMHVPKCYSTNCSQIWKAKINLFGFDLSHLFCEKQQTLLIFPHRGSKYIVWSVILQRVLTSRHSELLTALCGIFFSCNCSLSGRSVAQCVHIIIIVIGVLFVHQLSANHAPRASVTQVNHSAHTLSTFLRICADPSLQIFWISVTVAACDTFFTFSTIPFFTCTKRTNDHRDHYGFHKPHSLYF